MRIWDKFITDQDRQIYEASGFGARGGFGNRPALVIVDVNNAFVGDRDEPIFDSIKKWRHSCGPAAWKAIPPTQHVLRAARASRIPIFFTTGVDARPDGFDRGAWSFKNNRSSEDQKINTTVPGIRGKDIIKQIEPLPSEIVIRKYKPSAFYGTPLQSFLVDLQIDTLLICGTTTSGCVRGTVIDAFNSNYHITVIEDCCFDRFESSHAMTLFDINAKYGDVISSDEVARYLDGVERGLYDQKLSFPLAGRHA